MVKNLADATKNSYAYGVRPGFTDADIWPKRLET